MSHARPARQLVAPLLVATLGLAAVPPAAAQYFGRNKVQYKQLDFQVMKTEHFDIYFYPSAREGIDLSARMAERWLARLQAQLGHELRGRQPLILYGSHVDFEQTTAIGGLLGESTGGVTEPLRRRIVLPLAGPLADTDHVIGHELVHAFQFDMTTRPQAGPGETGANALPLWFIEGMAEYLSVGPLDPLTAMWMRDAARDETLPSIDDLNDPRYFPYRWGQAFWAYVGGTYGDAVIGRMLVIAAAAGNPEVAFKQVLGVDQQALSVAWQASIRQSYSNILQETTPPAEVGTPLFEGDGFENDLNIGPSLSPDGSMVAFLSQRSLLSIDLYVADTASGDIRHRLTRTSTSPHYSSLQFIYSAGAWDADSRRLALATVNDGRATLAIFDARSGERQRDFRLEEVDEIFNPTWSPDGRRVAFTGQAHGLTDLYVLDLTTGQVQALTHDPWADLQPAWSPDGQRIAFATDRFSSRLDVLAIGEYRIGIVDLSAGLPADAAATRIEPLGAIPGGKQINPQWAPDSRQIYFISDRDGIANLYRAGLDGSSEQLTTVATGLTGITAASPALSVAAKSGTVMFSVYDKGRYRLHTYVPAGGRETAVAAANPRAPGRALLPPVDRQPSAVVQRLNDPLTGLPAPGAPVTTTDYRANLHLDAIGQPSIAFGADRFGAAIGGGLSFYFSDLLGHHNLAAAVNASQGIGGNFALSNTAGQLAYFNQAHRWNWGVVGGQVPYLSGGFVNGYDSTSYAEPAYVEQTILSRQTERSAAGVASYPFSRARRVEFQAGVSQLGFDRIVETQAYSLDTGALLADTREKTKLADSLTLGTASAALVFDTSNFGATSPVAGTRYRFEVAPTVGSIRYTSVLADYRRYLMPVPFYTLAFRAMHYGRYGAGASRRLNPLYLGYPNLVRGYDVYSFGNSECVPNATSDCPAIDRLVGSRVMVGNVELRVPLLRPFGVAQGMYGPLPIELALFADGGVAWSDGERPSLLGGDRRGVASVGVAIRANLFGFAIGEFDFSRPLQRPGRGWIFQFNLSPGW